MATTSTSLVTGSQIAVGSACHTALLQRLKGWPEATVLRNKEFRQLPAVWGPPIDMSIGIGVGGNSKTSIFMF